MNKKLVRDGFEYYVEIESQGGEDYEYHMLVENEIENLLPLNIMTVNERKMLIYAASGYRILENSSEKMRIKAEDVFCIIDAILKGIDSIKKFLLDPNSLVLSPDCIFLEKDCKKIGLVYVPGYQKDIIIQLRELMEFLLERIDQTDTKNVILSWKLYILLKEEQISLKEIRKVMENSLDQKTAFEKGETIYYKEREKEELVLPQPKEKERGSGKKEWCPKAVKWETALLVAAVLGALLSGALVLKMFVSIYRGGILIWKRNLLLLSIFLCTGCVTAACYLHKRGKERQTLTELKRRMKQKKEQVNRS